MLPPSEITSSGFLVSWMPIEGGEKYSVIVSDDEAFDENNLVKGFPTTTTSTSYQVSGLEANTRYYYQVKINSTEAEYSIQRSVTTLPLLAPQIHYPKQITPLSFVAQWLSVDEAEGYQLYVSEDANFTTHIDGYDGKLINDTTALVSGLTVDKNYFYRVRTLRGASISVVSELMEVSTSALAKPILLAPTDTSFTSVTINWKAVEGATSYRIYVATDPLVITSILPEYNGRIVVNAASLIITGINANTTYHYRVQALNEQSTSEVSDVGKLSTVKLNVPTARTATAVGIDGFQANWDSVANASSYVLDVSSSENFTSYLTGYRAKEVVDTSEVVSGLLRNTNYYYRVRSKGFGAVSANSNVVQLTTSSFASPRALEATELQPTSFRAVWRPVAEADSYRLEVATDANFENNLPNYNNIPVSDTTQQVTNLVVNRRYFYRVRALKGGIFSGYSNIIDLTTTNLSVPQNLTVSNQQLDNFTINWNEVTGATGYEVDVGFDPLVENLIHQNLSVSAPATSITVGNLEANRVYYFKVRAKNTVSTGGSATGSGKTAPIDPPVASPPTGVEITSFQANWQPADDADDYLLDVAIGTEFNDLVAGYNGKLISGATLSLVTGLEPGRTYHYRVRSRGAGAVSDYSNVISVTTTSLPPPAVAAATNQEVYKFTANWQEVTGADKYLLDVATDPGFANILPSYNSKQVLGSSHEVTGLDPYTDYYYRLQSKQSNAVSGFSSPKAVPAVIGSGCMVIERDFSNLGRETYTYGGSSLTIDLLDNTNSIVRRSEVVYTGDLVSTVAITDYVAPSMDETWTYTYETYDGTEERIKEILIKDALSVEVRKIHFSYVSLSSNRITTLRYRDLSTNSIEKRSSYVYSSTQITVSDSSATASGLNKRLTLDDKFHAEAMLPADIALLLFNPTEPGEVMLPFIPEQRPVYYEYNMLETPKTYAYPYANISKGIPKRILANGGVPKIEYSTTTNGSCNF